MWVLQAAFLIGVSVQPTFLQNKKRPTAAGSLTWLAMRLFRPAGS